MTTAAPASSLPAPLLGEWACLGILYAGPAHGWAVATRLRPDGDIGRIWHLSRPLTYRALDRLAQREWVEAVGEERGGAGPNRTILAVTRRGRARLRRWVRSPVPHLRDLRGELLLKLVFAELHRIGNASMLDAQRAIVDRQAATLDPVAGGARDVVDLWRFEATRAAQRFLARIDPVDPDGHRTGT